MSEEPQPSTSSAVTVQPADSQPTATTSSAAPDMNRHFHRKPKRKANKAGDDSLFNSWLSSEIEKNQIKSELMKSKISKIFAEKEVIELQKIKLSLEIQNLQTPFQSALFTTELWLPVLYTMAF